VATQPLAARDRGRRPPVPKPTAAPLALLCAALLAPALAAAPPLTVAEASDFKATSRHEDVMAFCRQLAKESPVVTLDELGVSHEGRVLPLLILADPPVATPAEAARSKKLVVFAMGNIHAGEVDGKEALLMLAREIALAKDHPLLKQLVILICPIFNADGNERITKGNRRHQTGPDEGVGIRQNAQGFDLNRDFVKLESPEVRALVRLLNAWDPAVFIDCHTTNGSLHRYTLTYEGGRCPAGDRRLNAFTNEVLLPEVTRRMQKQTGYLSYFYGNFSRDRSQWQTVPPTPRYGTHYVSLRNRIAILSESYVYASYKDRILATKAFVKNILDFAAENRGRIAKMIEEARKPADDKVVLRYEEAAQGRPTTLLGFEEEMKDGRRVSTGKPKSYEVVYMGGTTAKVAVSRPFAYLVPAGCGKAVEALQRHGVRVEELRENIDLDVEAYRVDHITRERREFQKHQAVSLDVTPRKEGRRIRAGTLLVRTEQPLGSLAAFFLEPQSSDGLVTWNFFDADLKEGADFPVLRLPAKAALTTCEARPLADGRMREKPITLEAVLAEKPLSFSGSPVSGLAWLDADHFLQEKDGRLQKVHAVTGRCQPLFDRDKVAKALASLPTIDDAAAKKLAEPARLRFNPAHAAALFEHQDDLYHATLDGARAVRLTKAPGAKELATFSPDGKFVAYVKNNNLNVVDVATQTGRALTEDGAALVRNGKASWVYFEEIFNRDWQAYWWSPDSKQIAFLRFDERAMPRFNVVDELPLGQRVENTPYPKAGQANPLVRLGVVSVGGGPVKWVDLSGYSEPSTLVVRATWTPDGQTLFFYVQDRAQTWLDVCAVPAAGGEVKRLFRDRTKAWVEDPGDPVFLKDGSFLFLSERSGWKHLYHYGRDGKLRRQVTSGEWEVRQLNEVDEEKGLAYVTATKDSHLANNLYRVRLATEGCERLTDAAGSHAVTVGPKGKYFVDSWSSHTSPAQVRLAGPGGDTMRMIDTNPVYVREEYRTGTFELVQVKTPDGFVLEGSLLKPPDFDPNRRYPVWFMTYAGPHAPTVQDTWGNGRVRDEVLAQMGFVVFRADPRSASGKGACSTWTAYRQLGVQELKDIATLIGWLTKHSWVDPQRVGMSGGSYGGFMTSYALTHSKLFAAGVASFPVTDWRLYDSIYTERYMNTPQENKEGYEATSVVKAAKQLHGKLLLIHGLMDDNVHAQNTIRLMDALQKADREFEVMFYPRDRHGIAGPHYQRLIVEFMRRALRPGR
jgi:dipeptidyl aminopeptidase/acylaminoacyl peptidase